MKGKLKLVFLTPFSSFNGDEDKNAENAGTIEDFREWKKQKSIEKQSGISRKLKLERH
jgi:hypothetical protein